MAARPGTADDGATGGKTVADGSPPNGLRDTKNSLKISGLSRPRFAGSHIGSLRAAGSLRDPDFLEIWLRSGLYPARHILGRCPAQPKGDVVSCATCFDQRLHWNTLSRCGFWIHHHPTLENCDVRDADSIRRLALSLHACPSGKREATCHITGW